MRQPKQHPAISSTTWGPKQAAKRQRELLELEQQHQQHQALQVLRALPPLPAGPAVVLDLGGPLGL